MASLSESRVRRDKSKSSLDKSGGTTRKNKRKYNSYKQFIGNKEEGQGFADKRKRKIIYEYNKLKHKDRKQQWRELRKQQHLDETDKGSASLSFSGHVQKLDVESKQDEDNTQDDRPKGKRKRMNPFSKDQLEFKRQQEEKQKKMEEAQKIKEDREKALAEYKRKKKETHWKFSQKTKKGQPIMKYRIDHLLDQIQAQTSTNS
ncbi:thyroid transcription factor 1-associated protein 26 homolog [Saccoglossus kowalevskii]|uniref:Thyroid transcription factor 1-associated protein 26 homolog n=1 Tax=Saccoglossus kowalevskii TaxID=10224 RepID=A0ABM0M4E4_SACKO|nr:PREDICTED: thyroid transcription factor 1-associated protein 26 homolog [Saccoglossus kowalevskii]